MKILEHLKNLIPIEPPIIDINKPWWGTKEAELWISEQQSKRKLAK